MYITTTIFRHDEVFLNSSEAASERSAQVLIFGLWANANALTVECHRTPVGLPQVLGLLRRAHAHVWHTTVCIRLRAVSRECCFPPGPVLKCAPSAVTSPLSVRHSHYRIAAQSSMPTQSRGPTVKTRNAPRSGPASHHRGYKSNRRKISSRDAIPSHPITLLIYSSS